uniref:SMC hinge domain-containing protein n=1 Tax=Syphacia muris TaxID=451379 RepID=A0A0N5ACQ0_9BILA
MKQCSKCHEAVREERNARENLEAVEIEISQAEQEMRKMSARGIMNGVDSVRKVLQNFKNNNSNGQYDWILNGYHGILMELFICENIYHQAVEVTAGNRLFYHVVDDDRVAMKILKDVGSLSYVWINHQKLMGEVNFFPLNRLIAKAKKTTNNPDARPIMDSLKFDERYEVVFRHVFGGTAIVRNMLAGNNLAKTEGFDCVTFEGDQINRRGPMTGGYLDPKRCRLELFANIRNLMEQKKEIQCNLEAAIERNNERTAAVERLRMKGQDLEREVASRKNDHKLAADRKRALSQQLQQSQRNREPKA